MPHIDWTLSLSDILAYSGVALTLAWTLGRRLTHFEDTLKTHAGTLTEHSNQIARHDTKFDDAMEKLGELSGELQLLIGRTEFIAGRRGYDPKV